MIDRELIDPIAKSIAQALMSGFVEGDRVSMTIGRSTRAGTVVRLNRRKSGFVFPVVRFDDERRADMLDQEVLPSTLTKIDSIDNFIGE